jgi:hypothetical protein
MSLSDALRDAAASQVFWLGLAVVLVIAIVGYFLARRAVANSSPGGEEVTIIHDWIPTGRIDFAGPSMDAGAADTPASYHLQAEDIRLCVSVSGIERKEIRWRKATLNEAKRVVNVFHRQTAKEPAKIVENASPMTAPAEEGEPAGIDSGRDANSDLTAVPWPAR